MQYKEQRFIIPIADQLHCSQSTVCQRLHAYKIPIQSKLVAISQEELMLLYQQGHSVKQLAQHYHVSTRTIYNRLYDWHIKEPTRTQVDKDLPIAAIISSYESGNSAYTIAKEFRISPSTVIHLLQSKRIPLRHSHKRLSLPIKDICNLYTAHKLSTTQIANLYHVKAATIASRLRERRSSHSIYCICLSKWHSIASDRHYLRYQLSYDSQYTNQKWGLPKSSSHSRLCL